jgi:hypothetical protein
MDFCDGQPYCGAEDCPMSGFLLAAPERTGARTRHNIVALFEGAICSVLLTFRGFLECKLRIFFGSEVPEQKKPPDGCRRLVEVRHWYRLHGQLQPLPNQERPDPNKRRVERAVREVVMALSAEGHLIALPGAIKVADGRLLSFARHSKVSAEPGRFSRCLPT